MATYYAIAAGGNWSAGGTWSTTATKDASRTGGSSAPTTSDTCILDDYSGLVVVNATTCVCAALNCPGNTAGLTFTASQRLSVSGNVTFDSTMGSNLTGTGELKLAAAGTLTMDGLTFPGNITLGASATYTLADALVITGIFNANANTPVMAGDFDITCAHFVIASGALALRRGRKLTATTSITGGVTLSLTPGYLTTVELKSDLASTAAYLAYTGADASTLQVAGVKFTDIDFSTNSTPVKNLDNWYGNTLTRTVGITNRTSASLPRPTHSEALAKVAFVMRNATTFAPSTGETVSCERSLDGGAFGAGTLGGSGTATEIGSSGVYTIDFAAADMAGNTVTLRAVADGCEDTFVTMVTAGGTVASGTVVGGPTKNVALPKYVFVMRDASTHAPVTGKTVTCTRSIDGGDFGAGTLGSPTEISDGAYYVDFGAGDLNGNVIVLLCTASGCDSTLVTLVTGS